MDAQSVKTVEESGRIRGYDAHTCVKGCKRHLLVDTLGLPLSVSVTPANVHDTFGARFLLTGLTYCVPRLTKIWADQAYQGQEYSRLVYGHRWLGTRRGQTPSRGTRVGPATKAVDC